MAATELIGSFRFMFNPSKSSLPWGLPIQIYTLFTHFWTSIPIFVPSPPRPRCYNYKINLFLVTGTNEDVGIRWGKWMVFELESHAFLPTNLKSFFHCKSLLDGYHMMGKLVLATCNSYKKVNSSIFLNSVNFWWILRISTFKEK